MSFQLFIYSCLVIFIVLYVPSHCTVSVKATDILKQEKTRIWHLKTFPSLLKNKVHLIKRDIKNLKTQARGTLKNLSTELLFKYKKMTK